MTLSGKFAGRFAKAGSWLFLAFLGCFHLSAAEVIPPAPTQYFNDYAHVVSPATADRLNQTLDKFERDTSNQILVVIYPKMQSDSSIEDYTVRVFRAWNVGQKAKNNGAILFVFVQDHRMRIATGYGLEGALPDALCKRIMDDEITPRFKSADYDGGLTAGVNAILAATKGEYKGTGRTVAGSKILVIPGLIVGVIFSMLPILAVIFFIFMLKRLLGLGGVGRRSAAWTGWWLGSGGLGGGGWSGGGGGGWSGGGGGGWSGGGGGGGSFSGGGGSTGGGGASGSW